MAAELAVLLSALLIVGVFTQWLAWRLHLPPILLMLAGGLIAGPWAGWLDPDAVLGDLLQPLVGIGVAIILFEGGMTLRWRELRGVGRVLFLLISVGALVTWLVAAVAAHVLVGLDLRVALLLGAILTVSGPTVVGPLLNHIRPQGAVATLLRWEGIVIDPIGALLAVFVFLAIRAGGAEAASLAVLVGVAKATFIGVLAGLAAALILVVALARYWVPDHLQSAVALGLVLAAFITANLAQEESGLVAVTVMGIAMANQHRAPVRAILEFKETLRVLIIPALFILLTARLSREDLSYVGTGPLLFLLALLAARPVSVFLSTMGSKLAVRERLFLSGVMPRGIVAAAVASVLALDLQRLEVPDADALVPMTFLAIIGTVLVYGLGGRPLARVLKVSREGSGGVLLIGAGPFARALAHALAEEHVEVQLADTNRTNVTEASVGGLKARNLDALSEFAEEALGLERVDHVLALTPNDQTNQLAIVRYAEHVGRAQAFRVRTVATEDGAATGGRMLFSEEATWSELNRRAASGDYIARTKLTDKFRFSDWQAHHGPNALPLALVRASGRIDFIATDVRPEPVPGDTLLGLVSEEKAPSDEPRGGALGKMVEDKAPTPIPGPRT